jgi:hypothetical protein
MKYLKRFNESIDVDDIINDCKYILSGLIDNNEKVLVSSSKTCSNSDPELCSKKLIEYIFIDIESDKYIKFNEYETEFEELLVFLESYGYKLDKDSFVINNTWDPIEKCSYCEYVNTMINPKIKYYDESGECGNCGRKSHIENFLDDRHMISEGDINYFIKHKYWVEEVHLIFKKK